MFSFAAHGSAVPITPAQAVDSIAETSDQGAFTALRLSGKAASLDLLLDAAENDPRFAAGVARSRLVSILAELVDTEGGYMITIDSPRRAAILLDAARDESLGRGCYDAIESLQFFGEEHLPDARACLDEIVRTSSDDYALALALRTGHYVDALREPATLRVLEHLIVCPSSSPLAEAWGEVVAFRNERPTDVSRRGLGDEILKNAARAVLQSVDWGAPEEGDWTTHVAALKARHVPDECPDSEYHEAVILEAMALDTLGEPDPAFVFDLEPAAADAFWASFETLMAQAPRDDRFFETLTDETFFGQLLVAVSRCPDHARPAIQRAIDGLVAELGHHEGFEHLAEFSDFIAALPAPAPPAPPADPSGI